MSLTRLFGLRNKPALRSTRARFPISSGESLDRSRAHRGSTPTHLWVGWRKFFTASFGVLPATRPEDQDLHHLRCRFSSELARVPASGELVSAHPQNAQRGPVKHAPNLR